MRGFNRLSIQSKLMAMLLSVSIGSILVIAFEGYRSGRNGLAESAVQQLTGLRSSKANQIESYFEQLRSEMRVVGKSPMTIAATKALTSSFKSARSDAENASFSATELRNFYTREVAIRLSENTLQEVNPDSYIPNSLLAQYLQYQYIVNNPNPIGEKQALNGAGDGTNYSQQHVQYHPIFRQLIDEFGYYDLFLIDNDGNIIYSVYKEVDYATNLLSGPYARSGLAEAYRTARQQNSGYVTMTDFSPYEPSYGQPASFMATPIYDGISLVGVLAVQIPVDAIDSVMTNNRNWRLDGLGDTGETFLVGSDQVLRSNSRELVEDPENYFARLRSEGDLSEESITRIERTGTSILEQTATSQAVEDAIAGETDVQTVTNYLGNEVISAYAPLNIRDVDWVIVSEIDSAEIFRPIAQFTQRVMIAAAGLVFLITLASLWLAKAFLRPVNRLSEGFSDLAKGHKDVNVEIHSQDELGQLAKAFNHMVKKNRKTTEMVFKKTQETESLLLNMFPPSVAKRLKQNQGMIADEADSVSIVFINILGFEALTRAVRPQRAIEILNEIVSALDEVTEQYGIEKIKTTGSEYLAVSGLLEARLDHAKRAVDFAVESLRLIAQANREHDANLKIRAGVDTGGVMAGTIGRQRLIYDVWGETVVNAHKVQSKAKPNSVFVSKAVVNSLLDIYEFMPEGDITVRDDTHISVFSVVL